MNRYQLHDILNAIVDRYTRKNSLAAGQGKLFEPGDGGLFAKDTDKENETGVWRTIHGVHVFIANGKITKGPSHLLGKTYREALAHGSGQQAPPPAEEPKPDDKTETPQTGEINETGCGVAGVHAVCGFESGASEDGEDT